MASRVAPAGGSEDTYEAFEVEQRGIELIPAPEKKMTPSGLFWL